MRRATKWQIIAVILMVAGFLLLLAALCSSMFAWEDVVRPGRTTTVASILIIAGVRINSRQVRRIKEKGYR